MACHVPQTNESDSRVRIWTEGKSKRQVCLVQLCFANVVHRGILGMFHTMRLKTGIAGVLQTCIGIHRGKPQEGNNISWNPK